MPVVTREDLIPSLIENTTMQKMFVDVVHRGYNISPIDGYVLHDKEGDWEDPETGELFRAFYTMGTTCGATYDFVANPREFYAVPENSVPADQIFGGGDNNDHEVM